MPLTYNAVPRETVRVLNSKVHGRWRRRSAVCGVARLAGAPRAERAQRLARWQVVQRPSRESGTERFD